MRRNKPKKMVEIPINPKQSHEFEHILGNSSNNVVDNHTDNDLDVQGNNVVDNHADNDLDVPVAIRKGGQASIKHFIRNFVYCAGLSLESRAFTTNLVLTIMKLFH